MIDMHTHVLFGVDDGPERIEETMKMIEQAHKEGITDIICTSHSGHPQYDVTRKEIEGQIELLKDVSKAAGSAITLHAGQEIRISELITERLQKKELLTLAGSRYVLIELPSQSIPAYTIPLLQELIGLDIIPVIAHPERNRAIAEKPHRLERLIRHGAVAQMTAGSLAGHFGKNIQKLSLLLIESNLIHLYGSDAHNLKRRPFLFEKGLSILEKKQLADIADLLLDNNERILSNESLFMLEPELPKPKKLFGIF